jgi:hypothetical protein
MHSNPFLLYLHRKYITNGNRKSQSCFSKPGFIGAKTNQPMVITETPKSMTDVEFLRDRFEADQTGQSSQCGWGMMLSMGASSDV